ncbi:MAG: hypothetical protein LBT54_06025 [Bifidobacteriaceae bacterium]|nr:hypothetical protein [Bifidobacteriaceae bacterium]
MTAGTEPERQPAGAWAAIDHSTVYGPGAVYGPSTVNNFFPAEPPARVVVGRPGPVASGFQPRLAIREEIEAARAAGASAVVLRGDGGRGKSQLARRLFAESVAAGNALTLWSEATTPVSVETTFAAAAGQLGWAADLPPNASRARAARFLDRLAGFDKPWLVVLDDVQDFKQLDDAGMWPTAGPPGWVVATTRRADALVDERQRARVEVGLFTPEEAEAYIADRLRPPSVVAPGTGEAAALAEVMGRLPLALGLATAHMRATHTECRDYLETVEREKRNLREMFPTENPDYPLPIWFAWHATIKAADAEKPRGLASRAAVLAALLDPAGHQEALWHTPAMRTPAGAADGGLDVLERYGLVEVDRAAPGHTVKMHAFTARAILHARPDQELAQAARRLADAHTQLPAPRALTDAVMRAANMMTLVTGPGGAGLFDQTDGLHAAAFGTANAAGDLGALTTAIRHYERLSPLCHSHLGPDHPDTLTTRNTLASGLGEGGDPAGAAEQLRTLLADCYRVLGSDHQLTSQVRANLTYFSHRKKPQRPKPRPRFFRRRPS